MRESSPYEPRTQVLSKYDTYNTNIWQIRKKSGNTIWFQEQPKHKRSTILYLTTCTKML